MRNKFEASTVEPKMKPITTLNDHAAINLVELILKGYIRDYKRAVKKHDTTTPLVNINKCRSDLNDPMYEAIFNVVGITKKDIAKEVGDIEVLRSL